MQLWQRMFKKESLTAYLKSDEHFAKTLTAKDLIGLGIGAVIGSYYVKEGSTFRERQSQPEGKTFKL